ncbi:MAG: small multi-drug export protein [Elusimicrobia bacterium]|nr:small multi-drug export protein [Elusimicrobiota bacterium]
MSALSLSQSLSRLVSPEVATVIVGALPISELRGAIPIALFVFKFPVLKAFLLAVAGNLIPIFPILFFLEKIAGFLSARFLFMKKFFDWLFDRTRKKFYKKYEIYGDIALILFVAVPLPVTGAWTGAMAAFLFGIRKLPAFIFISIGVLIAGAVVTATSLGLGFAIR